MTDKTKKKIIPLIIAFALFVASITAMIIFGRAGEQVQLVTTVNNDMIRVGFQSKDNWEMTHIGDSLVIQNTEYTIVTQIMFTYEDHVKRLLVEGANADVVIDREFVDGDEFKYVLMTCDSLTEDEPNYYALAGWVTGTDSAFVASSKLTKESTIALIENLDLSIKSTAQSDRSYYPKWLETCYYEIQPDDDLFDDDEEVPTDAIQETTETTTEVTNGTEE